VPGGTTIVVFCEGGGGLLLLKLRHPPSTSVRSNGNRRMAGVLLVWRLALTCDAFGAQTQRRCATVNENYLDLGSTHQGPFQRGVRRLGRRKLSCSSCSRLTGALTEGAFLHIVGPLSEGSGRGGLLHDPPGCRCSGSESGTMGGTGRVELGNGTNLRQARSLRLSRRHGYAAASLT
jgi:hypothetical protein